MKLSETHFVDGKPVGRIVKDSESGAIGFIPREGGKPLPERHWRDIDDLKRQLRQLYGRGSGDANHE